MFPAPLVPLDFLDTALDAPFDFLWSDSREPYLARLRSLYALDGVVAGLSDDLARVRAIGRWVRGRWEHNGDNEPSRADPITILREAEAGRQFRCVEYGIVLAGALTSLGIPARVLALKTADCETRPRGAGHVVAEAYLRDRRQWVLVDGQWDAIPLEGEYPLSAVAFQRALALAKPGLRVEGGAASQAEEYFAWIAPYLFYFDVPLDNRIGEEEQGRDGGGRLMLLPLGAHAPQIFQRRWPLHNYRYTSSLGAFYPRPL